MRVSRGRQGAWGAISVLAMSMALATGTAQAEGEGETELDPVPDVITVYGTTNPLPAFDYPGQVTVIDREAIEQRAASAVSDVLRDVPGVEFSGGPRRTGEVPAIRGLSGENVLVLLDGARHVVDRDEERVDLGVPREEDGRGDA